jgi:hypothetical protein
MSTIKTLIEQMIQENLTESIIPDDFKGLKFKKTKTIEDDYDITYFDIMDSSNKKVGEVKHSELTGLWAGHLYNKDFSFRGYEVKAGGGNPKKNIEAWIKTKTFQKWSANIDKYKSLSGSTNDHRLKSNKK